MIELNLCGYVKKIDNIELNFVGIVEIWLLEDNKVLNLVHKMKIFDHFNL